MGPGRARLSFGIRLVHTAAWLSVEDGGRPYPSEVLMKSLRDLSSFLRQQGAFFALTSALILSACPSNNGNGDGGTKPGEDGGSGGDGGPNPNDPCPAGNSGAFSVCQVQNSASPANPGAGGTVNLRGVVALTDVFDLNSTGTIKAVFVADVPLAEYGGVLVTFPGDQGITASEGQLLDVTGTVQEFSDGAVGSETRIQATFLQATGSTAEVTPLDVSDPSALADETLGEAYEGLLVQVRNVEVQDASLGFGQWQVTGGLTTDDTIYRYSAIEGEVLGNLVGVMGYNAFADGGFRLLPRKAADVVSTSKPTVSVTQLRDPAAEGYVAPCDPQDFSCPPVQITNVVVTSQTYFISSGSRGPLYGFFVADPAAVDGEGRLLPYSGVLVTISPQSMDISENSYTFAEDANHNFVGDDAAPQPGDVVSVNGQSSSYFDMAQIRFVTSLVKAGTVDTVDGVDMPLPARFDGALADTDPRHPSRLQGGRPEVTVEQGGTTRPAEAADAAVESWEGVLVELVNVGTDQECVGYPYSNMTNMVPAHMRDFGYWTVTGGAEIGTLFDDTFGGYWLNVAFDSVDRTCENRVNKCQDSRVAAQSFTSLTGIVNYSFNVYRVNPRSAADIQPPELFVAEGTGNCTMMP